MFFLFVQLRGEVDFQRVATGRYETDYQSFICFRRHRFSFGPSPRTLLQLPCLCLEKLAKTSEVIYIG